MNIPRYDFEFAELTNLYRRGFVQRTDRQTGHQYSCQVTINDDDFLLRRLESMAPEVADLVDLAVAVHTADRMTARRHDLVYHIHVILPLRRYDILCSSFIMDMLEETLSWYTGDRWTFEFTRRGDTRRMAEHAVRLPYIADSTQPCEVALWSGGLDSLAGLCAGLLAGAPSVRYTLLSTGSNSYMDGVQREVALGLQANLKARDRVSFMRIPIRFRNTSNLGKNPYMRSRGFSFLMIGAACALIEGQAVLHVYENGIGALNLPYRASEVAHDHSRSVHPLSLLRMAHLVSHVLGERFTYENPFLLQTKARMCWSIARIGLADIIPSTVSCDSRHREEAIQCGYCSSCLLRRQALAAQGISDHTRYVIDRPTRPAPHDAAVHLRAMEKQVAALCAALHTFAPWHALSIRFEYLDEVAIRLAAERRIPVAEMRAGITNLYSEYVQEWDSIFPLGLGWLRNTATARDAV